MTQQSTFEEPLFLRVYEVFCSGRLKLICIITERVLFLTKKECAITFSGGLEIYIFNF